MKQKLLLTSQGLPPELGDIFRSLLTKPPEQVKVAYITTAAYGEGNVRPEWLEIYKKQLKGYGIIDIEELDIKDKNQNQLKQILSDKEIIFVNGGNTFYLLHWIKQSGFDKLLPTLIAQGKLYVGISAGSYICCPTIEQSNWKHADKNKIGLNDLTALSFVPFLITAHYEEKNRQVIERAIKTTKYPVVALTDSQAILVEDNKYKIVGMGKKLFFNGFTENYAI